MSGPIYVTEKQPATRRLCAGSRALAPGAPTRRIDVTARKNPQGTRLTGVHLRNKPILHRPWSGSGS